MNAIAKSRNVVEASPGSPGVSRGRRLCRVLLLWACFSPFAGAIEASAQEVDGTGSELEQAGSIFQKMKEVLDGLQPKPRPVPSPRVETKEEGQTESETDPCATGGEEGEGEEDSPCEIPCEEDPCQEHCDKTACDTGTGTGPVSTPTPSPDPVNTASLRGVVRDQQGNQPLPRAQVAVTGGPRVITDGQGRYTLTNLPPGRHQVTVRKKGYRNHTGTVIVSSESTHQSFTLVRIASSEGDTPRQAGGLQGVVLDARTRRPLSGAIISVTGGPTTRTRQDGRFIIRNLRPRSYRVTVRRHGFSDRVATVTIRPARVVSESFALAPRSHSRRESPPRQRRTSATSSSPARTAGSASARRRAS